MDNSQLKFNSRAVFYEPDQASNSISYPIYVSANYQYADDVYDQIVAGERKAVNIYSRCGHPNEYKFEEQICRIHNADAALATASGMAAISHVLFGLLKQGDHIVADWTTYSSTHEFFDHRIEDWGITVTFVDTSEIEQVERAIQPDTKVIYFETLANPTMKISDLAALAQLGRDRNIITICDNTFASPAVCRPHDHGIDLVVESSTKFIGGHNDAVGGTITMRTDRLPEDWLEQVRWNTLTKLGGALAPFNAWLLLRGIQTLAIRVRQQTENALAVASWLEADPRVQRVWYPGLPSHPQHERAAHYFDQPGALLSFRVADEENAVRVLKQLELCSFAASLGGVRTTTQVPATMAFLDISAEQQETMGVFPGMIRVSVGIEDADDIIVDFDQAMHHLS